MTSQFDVVVIGGGLAGATAARDLATEGHGVCLLEAQNRLGGRVYHDNFGDTDITVSHGGTYVSRVSNRFMVRELERYGVNLLPLGETDNSVHLFGGQRISGSIPIPAEDILEFERVAFDMLKRSSQLDTSIPLEDQVTPELNMSWAAYMDELDPSPAIRDLFTAWAEGEGGGPAEDFSTLFPFWYTALHGYSIAAWELSLTDRIEGGGEALIEKMVDEGGFEVRLETPVARVEQRPDGDVEVTSKSGETVTARAAVVAVPMNCWKDLDFTPALSEAKRHAIELRPSGRTIKGSALVEDFPPRFLAHSTREAGADVTLVMSEEATHEGAQLVTFFSPLGYAPGKDEEFDVSDRDRVQKALERFAPGCRVVACGGHDWGRDPYAQGTWVTCPVELPQHLAGMRAAEGRVAFATADIARGFTIWMDGAIESGEAAANEVGQMLATAMVQ